MWKPVVLPVLMAFAFLSSHAQADLVIDFDTDPTGAASTDNAPLTSPYIDPSGVTVMFGIDSSDDGVANIDADPKVYFEESGDDDPDNGFRFDGGGDPAVYDTGASAVATARLGDFFLRADTLDGSVGGATSSFLVQFGGFSQNVVTGTFGDIWDIDGTASTNTEQYLVEAYGLNGSLLASQLSPEGISNDASSLDGRPWRYDFSGFNQGIDHIKISFVGSKTTGIGLAFDAGEITSAAIPEPSSVILTGMVTCLFCGHGVIRRRRRRAASPQS
ncbi:hypothetical protein CA85_20230 [Allorhodopirellula solitaria]|uniref:PEP-CTERM protein-sorting domain-containing protein n=2 Tax=Allorhodopirellula solitaria TaxID=2527987 RepID=A0A5C5XW93_9BACT|nr:hypothetical protein CA85_20230 [Allorhodopirellula solitaria]